MATTQPVLAGNTLPYPAAPGGYDESIEYRGGSAEMADGSVVFDLVNATGKHLFVLRWQNITGTQKATVETAYAAIKTSYTSNNFTAPTGTTYTVQRDPGQAKIDWKSEISKGSLVWSGELRLREV